MIEIISNKDLSDEQRKIINDNRVKELGLNEDKDFKKDYEPETKWFFLKKAGKVVSFAGLRPIVINYLGEKYEILGICSVISIVKGKGYGREIVKVLIDYSKKTGKTILGFTNKTDFFEKAGLNIKKNFIRRFVYVNPKTKEEIYDDVGDGIFYDGEDNFIEKVLSNKAKIKINIAHW